MEELSKKRLLTGEVVSDKMDKTIVVLTSITQRHPRFGKILKRTKKYKVHDEKRLAKTGDIVAFYESRPLSKTKYMTLARVVQEASRWLRVCHD